MTPRIRYRAWQAVVILLVGGQSSWLVTTHVMRVSPMLLWLAIGFFELIIACLIALLSTTPPDAIRLSTRQSQLIILVGAGVLYAAAIIPSSDPKRWGPALAMIIVFPIAEELLRRRGRSSWWMAPVAWNPLLLVFLGGIPLR